MMASLEVSDSAFGLPGSEALLPDAWAYAGDTKASALVAQKVTISLFIIFSPSTHLLGLAG